MRLAKTAALGAALGVALVLSLASACAPGTSDIVGGAPRFDPNTDEQGTDPEDDPDADVDAAGFAEESIDAGSGTTFTDLYRDLFAPTAPSACAGVGTGCHNGPDQAGTANSHGFLCAENKTVCYESLFTSGTITPDDFGDPRTSTLYRRLRHRSGTKILGTMPLAPSSYVFSRASTARIKTWIANGAKND